MAQIPPSLGIVYNTFPISSIPRLQRESRDMDKTPVATPRRSGNLYLDGIDIDLLGGWCVLLKGCHSWSPTLWPGNHVRPKQDLAIRYRYLRALVVPEHNCPLPVQ